MNKYLLLLYYSEESEAAFDALPADERRAAIQKYKDFAERLAAEGRLIDAEGLKTSGKVVRKKQGEISVTDGPYTLVKELVGGFYLFTAANLEEATELAKQCPALETGGTIDVREI